MYYVLFRFIFLMLLMLFWSASTPDPYTMHGMASYYSSKLNGHRTSSGERLNNDSMTCAHRSLPFGTMLEIYCHSTQKKVIVRINDRGPFHPKRIVDVTQAAARKLGITRMGTAYVSARIYNPAALPVHDSILSDSSQNFR